MKKEKATPKSSPNTQSHSTPAQRQRILQSLRIAANNGLTTIQLREEQDIMMPAARVHELRWRDGYNIQTIRVYDLNAQGNKHHCSRYFLLPGKWRTAL